MAGIDDVLDPSVHDLTPEGDPAGMPPDGPDTAPELTGETTPNDPVALDEMFWPNPDLIDDVPRIEPSRDADVNDSTPLRVTTRLMESITTMTATMDPVQVFPADPNRIDLNIRCLSVAGATDPQAFRFGSDSGLVAGMAARAVTTDGVIRLEGHTGPLYVYVPEATASVIVSAWATTL